MESKKNTPNHIEKEGNNAKLKEELENLLEKELEKSPDEINTKKIDSIVHLLDEIDGKDEDNWLFRGNGGLKTATPPVFNLIRRHSTFG